MKRFKLAGICLFLVVSLSAQPPRKEFRIPDLPGYQTLKCDFHMHTVFSDGDVWPVARVAEAWEEGLDAIAITDHLEYNPKKDYLPVNHNASFEIAKATAEKAGIIFIHATEITKSMPPGHLNALFVKDASPVFNTDYKLAIEEANRQGAFVLWNHPGWKRQAPDGPKWTEVHDQLYKSKQFQGIEVANHSEWYPEVLDWALDKNLTIMSNSDMHSISNQYLKENNFSHRAMTLVFVKEPGEQGIREALNNGRTAGYLNDLLFGKKEWVEPLFYQAVKVGKKISESGNLILAKLTNHSDIPFTLKPRGKGEEFILEPGCTKMITLNLSGETKEATAEYDVLNVFIGSKTNLPVSFRVKP